MLKKLMIGSMGFLFLSSATLFSYRALEPKAATGIEESYLNAAQPSATLRSLQLSRSMSQGCIISIFAGRTTMIALISTNMSSNR